MVMEGEQGGVRSAKREYCNVQWVRGPSSETGRENSGGFAGEVSVTVFVAPELKLPRGKITCLGWTKTVEVHPLWFIKRGKPHEYVPNMELVYNSVSHIMASPFRIHAW